MRGLSLWRLTGLRGWWRCWTRQFWQTSRALRQFFKIRFNCLNFWNHFRITIPRSTLRQYRVFGTIRWSWWGHIIQFISLLLVTHCWCCKITHGKLRIVWVWWRRWSCSRNRTIATVCCSLLRIRYTTLKIFWCVVTIWGLLTRLWFRLWTMMKGMSSSRSWEIFVMSCWLRKLRVNCKRTTIS